MKAALLITGGIIISLVAFGPIATAALLLTAFLGLYLLGLVLS